MARSKTNLVPRLVNLLRLIWLLAIAWYELGTFYYHTSSCPWADESLSHSGTTTARPTHVLLVADPQILDHRSYPDRPPWLMSLSQFVVDLNLRKSWRATLKRRPDAVVFLGDMMDNGRLDMSDEEYNRYVRRFRSIFAADGRLPTYYIPGNHDIGLGSSSPTYRFSEHVLERYLSNFGPLNQRISISNHTALLIDAPGLVDEDRERALAGMSFAQWSDAYPGRTIAFVRSFAQNADPSEGARPILFTHVPLYRPEGTPCGPLRERGTLRQGRGLGYQNLLSEQASQFLLQSIRPAIIFSGDDHDYCEYVHSLPATDTRRPSPPLSIPELTVKSFSMAMGIRRPGYQLLSLTPRSASPEVETLAQTPCLLPDLDTLNMHSMANSGRGVGRGTSYPSARLPPGLGRFHRLRCCPEFLFAPNLQTTGNRLKRSFIPILLFEEISVRACSALVDIVIAAAMIYLLHTRRRSDLKVSNRILQRLIVLTGVTGSWTAIVALFEFIMMASYPRTLRYAYLEYPLSSLYVNAFLANLNAREFVRKTDVIEFATSPGTNVVDFSTISGMVDNSIASRDVSHARSNSSKGDVQNFARTIVVETHHTVNSGL
ncbi:hypothetical protein NUW54_g8643 [Trametes sanguinea]|uniref:Uncharacterized protein n=1 Tax=Trametes sanguinea TaxID=158606 RepID=A0ACC1PBW2_9APHY|nr:hypothetical protein NUW54_g8643 [Trametes sanguinea]